MAWKTMVALDRKELITLDTDPFAYFHIDLLVGFLSDRNLPFIDNLCSSGFCIEREVFAFYGTQGLIQVP